MIEFTLYFILPLCIFGTKEIVKMEFKDTPLVKYVMTFLIIVWLSAVISYNMI